MDELQQLMALAGATTFAEAVANMTAVNTQIRAVQSALGTSDAASTFAALSARSAQLSAVEKATGKTGEEAVGVVHAAMLSHTELPKMAARIGELEKVERGSKLAEMFATAEKEKRLTPAIREAVQAQVDAGMTLAAAEAWLKSCVPVPGISATQKNEPATTPVVSNKLKHEGKTFGEMNGRERVELKRSNPELYEAMRSSAA
jgi:cell division protein ZapA (FtsZ GTPase activity inhibitor)